jgi:hypothetical protein
MIAIDVPASPIYERRHLRVPSCALIARITLAVALQNLDFHVPLRIPNYCTVMWMRRASVRGRF